MARTRDELLALCDCDNCPIALRGARNPYLPETLDDAALAKINLMIVPETPGQGAAMDSIPGALTNATLKRVNAAAGTVAIASSLLCQPGRTKEGLAVKVNAAMLNACAPRLAAQIEDASPDVVLTLGANPSKKLLGTNAPIMDLQSVMQFSDTYNCWIIPTVHPLQAWMDADKYPTLRDDISRAVRFSDGRLPLPERVHVFKWTHVTTAADAIPLLLELARGDHGDTFAIDVETNGLRVHEDELLQVAIGSETEAWVFDAETIVDSRYNFDTFRAMLLDPRYEWIMHNMQFDMQYFIRYFGVGPEDYNSVDTLCLALGVSETNNHSGLKYLSRKYFNAPYYENEIKQYLKPSAPAYRDIPRDVLAKYAAADVIYTARLRPILDDECRTAGTLQLAYGLLMDSQRMFAQMAYDGVHIDQGYIEPLHRALVPEIQRLTTAIQNYADAHGWDQSNPINPRAAGQKAHLLYDLMKLTPPISPKVKKARQEGKTPPRHVGKEFYEKYPNHELTPLFKDFSRVDKLYATYVKGIQNFIGPDGRVHQSFRLDAAVTGRISITEPALQTIPGKDKAVGDADVKKLFAATPTVQYFSKPAEEWVFVGADYSQLELRIAWHLANDPAMAAAIMTGDFHRTTAAAIHGVPPEMITPVQRKATKYVTFGIIYGRTEHGLYAGELGQLGFSLSECKDYRDGWLARFPTYVKKMDEYIAMGRRNGKLRTEFGRVRRWDLITPKNLQHVSNQMLNFPGQSTASDLCLNSAIILNRKLRTRGWGRGLFMVHDSIEIEVRKQFLQPSLELMYETMVTPPFKTPAKFDVEIEYGPNWGDMDPWHPTAEFLRRVSDTIDKSQLLLGNA